MHRPDLAMQFGKFIVVEHAFADGLFDSFWITRVAFSGGHSPASVQSPSFLQHSTLWSNWRVTVQCAWPMMRATWLSLFRSLKNAVPCKCGDPKAPASLPNAMHSVDASGGSAEKRVVSSGAQLFRVKHQRFARGPVDPCLDLHTKKINALVGWWLDDDFFYSTTAWHSLEQRLDEDWKMVWQFLFNNSVTFFGAAVGRRLGDGLTIPIQQQWHNGLFYKTTSTNTSMHNDGMTLSHTTTMHTTMTEHLNNMATDAFTHNNDRHNDDGTLTLCCWVTKNYENYEGWLCTTLKATGLLSCL